MANKIRKCGYARVSTLSEEQEHSLLAQTEYYKNLIESDQSAEFVGIYADKKSGKDTRHRPQFTEMIRAAKRGEIDCIITKSIARFARNLVQTLKTVRELREINVGVFFEKEGIDTLSSTSDFMLSIYATVAESELTSMGDNVKWAARRRASQGIVEQTNNLYGYDFKRGVFAVIESEATIVREVFTRYANGDGQKLIARDLNDRGLFKRSGGLWKASDLARMLAIEKYVGDALLQKTYNAGLKTYLNDGAVKQYYIENNHEPIVDRDTFDRARARQAEQYEATRPKNGVETHPLSGKIFCGLCGKPYIRRKNNRNTPYEKWIWSDYTYVQFGRKYCGGHNIREVDLQAIFLSAYNEAAAFERTDTQTYNLSESINALLAQERELIALKVKGYITRGAYEIQHGELVKQIKETEAALLLESRRTGDGDGDAESLARIDREIESAQAAMLELNKQRARRAIDAEAYGEQSRATMAELDGLFIKRDELARQAGDRSLGDARRKMLTEFLSAQEPQTEFDRDVFGKLVETVIVNSREDIIFEFKDGTRIKAQTDGGR